MGQLPAVDQLPDGISIDEKSFKFKDKIFNYDKIKSIRIYSVRLLLKYLIII